MRIRVRVSVRVRVMCQPHLGDDRRALPLELGVRGVAPPGLLWVGVGTRVRVRVGTRVRVRVGTTLGSG